MENVKLLRARQVAERLATSVNAVYQLCCQKKIGHYRIGKGKGDLRFTEEDVRLYLECVHVPAESEPPALPAPRKMKPKEPLRLRFISLTPSEAPRGENQRSGPGASTPGPA